MNYLYNCIIVRNYLLAAHRGSGAWAGRTWASNSSSVERGSSRDPADTRRDLPARMCARGPKWPGICVCVCVLSRDVQETSTHKREKRDPTAIVNRGGGSLSPSDDSLERRQRRTIPPWRDFSFLTRRVIFFPSLRLLPRPCRRPRASAASPPTKFRAGKETIFAAADNAAAFRKSFL